MDSHSQGAAGLQILKSHQEPAASLTKEVMETCLLFAWAPAAAESSEKPQDFAVPMQGWAPVVLSHLDSGLPKIGHGMTTGNTLGNTGAVGASVHGFPRGFPAVLEMSYTENRPCALLAAGLSPDQ